MAVSDPGVWNTGSLVSLFQDDARILSRSCKAGAFPGRARERQAQMRAGRPWSRGEWALGDIQGPLRQSLMTRLFPGRTLLRPREVPVSAGVNMSACCRPSILKELVARCMAASVSKKLHPTLHFLGCEALMDQRQAADDLADRTGMLMAVSDSGV